MKPKTKSITWTVALAAALCLVGVRPCAADITPNLLTLPNGYDGGMALAVNASGQVVGDVINSTEETQDACVWTDGTPTVLPEPTGYRDAVPTAINSSGVVAGTVYDDSGNPLAVYWTPNSDFSIYTVEDLGFGTDVGSEADAINDQGQILCDSGDYFYLWEDGTTTEITDGNGNPVVDMGGLFFGSPWGGEVLASNGRVAGIVNLGNGSYQAVLWQMNDSGTPTVTDLTPADAGPGVDAISPNGVVVGFSDADGIFVYDSNSGTTTSVEPPADNGTISYTPIGAESVNDQGQVVFAIMASDSSTDPATDTFQLWVWDAGTWTQIPLDSLLPAGSQTGQAVGMISNSGQVVGVADYEAGDSIGALGFCWSSGTGIEELDNPVDVGTPYAFPFALDDYGLAVGAATNWLSGPGGFYLPVTWSLPALTSALDVSVSGVTSPSPHSPNITVTVMITNPSTTDRDYDVIVTSATLGGVDSNSALPLLYGAIKPGATKQCTLHFKNVPSGDQTLTINGISSLGDFSTTQTVSVP